MASVFGLSLIHICVYALDDFARALADLQDRTVRDRIILMPNGAA